MDKAAAPLDDLPAPLPGLGVVHGVHAAARPPGQADQPGAGDAARQADPLTDGGDASVGRRKQRRAGLRNLGYTGRVTNGPTGVVFSVRVATVEHVTSPSRWFLRMGGVSLGRCGSTGPAVFPGVASSLAESAAGDEWPRSWNVTFQPALCGRGAVRICRVVADVMHAQRWHGLLFNRRLA